jgi:hypothetical protein
MREVKMLKSIVVLFVGTLLTFSGCSDAKKVLSSKKSVKQGYFVSVFKHSVEYKCENKRKKLPKDGEFECNSFPIAFYMDSVKLGEINSIHEDGYVFPQDIILLENGFSSPVYTSDDSMNLLSSYKE